MFSFSFDISYFNGSLFGSKIGGANCIGKRKFYLSPALFISYVLAITL